MLDNIQRLFEAARHALDLVVQGAIAVDPWWLAAGIALHVVSQAVRTVGWFNIIRAAYPRESRELRPRDVITAYFGGAGLNAIVPARGGDVVKLALVHRRLPRSRYSTLLATFVPETLFETVFGIGLLVWALAQGFVPVPVSRSELPTFDVSFIIRHPILTSVGVAVAAAAIFVAVRRLRRSASDLLERLRHGLAILETPRHYLTGVVSWQAAGRVIRLGSLACFMAAFALPVTLATVVLVMAAQGGGRIIPIAPASAGLRIAMLYYGFGEVTGDRVDVATITAFSFGTGAAHTAVGLVISAIVIGRELDTLSPKRAVAAAREALTRRRAQPAARS
jgi:uncharacterized membrane protein YbhN (UPF0104 family)